MKKIIVIVVILAVGVVFFNDMGSFVNARRVLIEATRDAAEAAVSSGGTANVAGPAAVAAAAVHGVEVYGYDQSSSVIQVWARKPVEGTFVYGPVSALIAGESTDTPPMLEHSETRPVR